MKKFFLFFVVIVLIMTAPAASSETATITLNTQDGVKSATCDDSVKPRIYNSIGVYGGSISSVPESDSTKLFWQRELNIPVVTHGVGGAGFTENTNVPIPKQIDNSPSHDIVILWCSTNDFKQPVENDEKYSPKTQNGGMRIAIEKLKSKNPRVIILGFCSLPCFTGLDGAEHVDGQIKVFKEYGIPYLNQYHYFMSNDLEKMYKADKLHFTADGYIHIRERQLEFIRRHILTSELIS